MDDSENRSLINEKKTVKYCRRYDKKFCLNLIRRSLAEFLGSALFVFVGAISMSAFIGNYNPPLPTVALVYGFSYAGLSGAIIHVSGGHLNPAITLGVFVAGGINVLAVLFYWLAQIIGSIVGAGCVLVFELGVSFNAVSNENVSIDRNVSSIILHSAATKVLTGVSPASGILIEMLMSMILVAVFVNTSMEEMRTASPALSGLTLAALVLASYKLTGGSVNPARSFGPAVVLNDAELWKYHYVYWIGPLLGGLLAGGVYRLLLSSKPLVPLVTEHVHVYSNSISINELNN